MATGHNKPEQGNTGRQAFLAQRARLRASVTTTLTNDTAARYNRLDETQRKVIFMLANAASPKFKGLPQLGRALLATRFEGLSEPEQRSLMLGIKRLSELAAAMPWEFSDLVAPHNEIQMLRDLLPTTDSTVN
ncbi:hypothetical protein [Cedecea davisae]|uniref:hypothetical protein n=1 Tax=Cedecea davisae TaxID=158484 RepID=UPI00242EF437|nr:hypothetical protein [Cedecea davisae]